LASDGNAVATTATAGDMQADDRIFLAPLHQNRGAAVAVGGVTLMGEHAARFHEADNCAFCVAGQDMGAVVAIASLAIELTMVSVCQPTVPAKCFDRQVSDGLADWSREGQDREICRIC
jgi:hypothetical protein